MLSYVLFLPFAWYPEVGSICVLSPPFYRSLWTMTCPWLHSYWCMSLELNQHSDCYFVPWHPDTYCEVHTMWVPGGMRDGERKTSNHFYDRMTSSIS